MPHTLRCSQCSATLTIPDQTDAGRVRCARCGYVQPVSPPEAASRPAASPKAALSDDDVLAILGPPPGATTERGFRPQ